MLIVRTRPKHDESYLGFLLRLTELNLYETPYWIVQEASLRPKGYIGICSFVFDPEVDLAPLADLSGLNVDALQDLVYYPIDDRYGVRVFGQRLPRYLLRLRESRVCPECLKQSTYWRKQWDLAVVTSCPIHQILLLENCHKCGRKITWRRRQVSFCQCGADWRSAQMELLPESETLVSRLVYQKFGLMEPASESVNNNPLYLLDLPSILEALFLIASQQERRIDTKGRSIGGKQSREIHANLAQAFSVFESWPDNFYKFLDQVRSVKKSSKAKSGLNNNFGGVYRHIYTSGKLSPSLCEVLRNEFERYVSEYWDDGYLARSKWFKASSFTGRYVSQRKACRELGLKVDVLERFVTSGKLRAVVRRNGRKRLFLVEAESVEQLKLDPPLELKRNRKLGSSRWFSMDEVSELFGISRLSVVRLVKGSLLISKHGPSADQRRAVWKFDKETVHGFLTGVLSTTKTGAKRNRITELQSFTVVSNVVGRRFAGSDYGVHTLVSAILNGLLIPRVEAANKSGLARLQFSREEVHHYINTRWDLRKESPWIVAGAKKLGIRAEVAQFLASKGLIETGARTCQEETPTAITREGILLFESTYLFAFDVARALGTTTSLLIRALRALDVHPISGKLIDDGAQYVFRKADLEPVDWSKFISIFPSKKKSEAVLTGGFLRGSATYLTF
jgi:hypothetical protein